MSQVAQGPAASGGPVLLGVIGPELEEAAMGHAFAAADDRDVALLVVVTAAAPAGEDRSVAELIDRWSEKYPGVVVTTSARRGIDAVVTLAAASRGCSILVVQEPASARSAALLNALSHRVRCPVVVAGSRGYDPAATIQAARESGADHQVHAVATGAAQGGSTATGQAVRPMSARTVSPSGSSSSAGPLRAAITTSETSPLSASKALATSRSCRISRSAASASTGVRWS